MDAQVDDNAAVALAPQDVDLSGAGLTIATLGHSTNLVGLPTWLLGDTRYNEHPAELRIGGIRQEHRSLFRMLDTADSPARAAELFQDYMLVVFGLDPDQRRAGRRFRGSYTRLLKGWMFDSNGPEGAVLKGWVESRFGLFPTFHKEPIRSFSGRPWITYVEEKMASRFHDNAIMVQLDLLYEYAQWALRRFHTGQAMHWTLYRGTNGFCEHPVLARPNKREAVLRLNNLVSFTTRREIADEFGDFILETRVPVTKVLFFRELLPGYPFQGEGEVIAVGGAYHMKVAVL